MLAVINLKVEAGEVTVPTIETWRLVLRAHCLDDFEPLVAMWADPDVVPSRSIGTRPAMISLPLGSSMKRARG